MSERRGFCAAAGPCSPLFAALRMQVFHWRVLSGEPSTIATTLALRFPRQPFPAVCGFCGMLFFCLLPALPAHLA